LPAMKPALTSPPRLILRMGLYRVELFIDKSL